jgi:hypothetical protein
VREHPIGRRAALAFVEKEQPASLDAARAGDCPSSPTGAVGLTTPKVGGESGRRRRRDLHVMWGSRFSWCPGKEFPDASGERRPRAPSDRDQSCHLVAIAALLLLSPPPFVLGYGWLSLLSLAPPALPLRRPTSTATSQAPTTAAASGRARRSLLRGPPHAPHRARRSARPRNAARAGAAAPRSPQGPTALDGAHLPLTSGVTIGRSSVSTASSGPLALSAGSLPPSPLTRIATAAPVAG